MQWGLPPWRRASPVAVHCDCVVLSAEGIAADGVVLDGSMAGRIEVDGSAADSSTAGSSAGDVLGHSLLPIDCVDQTFTESFALGVSGASE